MNNTASLDHDAILRRAHAAAEVARAKLGSLFMPYLIVTGCGLGIVAAAAMEVFSATVGFRAAFPTLSDGTSLADAIMPMAYAIGPYMLLGSVLLSGIIARFGASVSWLLDGLGLIAIVLMLCAIGLFMFSATFQTVGDGEEPGIFAMLGGFSGAALGTMCASLFTVSFLAAHGLWSIGLKRLVAITDSRTERAKLADLDGAIAAARDDQRRLEIGRHEVAELAKPDALRWKAATEAARIVAPMAAQAHELSASRQMWGEPEPDADHVAEFHDVPIEVLERLSTALKTYTPQYFFNLLKKEI